MKAINTPVFVKELQVANLLGLSFSWSPDGQLLNQGCTEAQWTQVLAVYDAHDPTLPNKDEAKFKIDEMAGKTRSKYLTTVPGQEATYIAKEADCRAYKAALYPVDTTPYPWVEAEVLATNLSATDAADLIISQADQWRTVGALIEAVRRKAKLDVDTVTNQADLDTLLQATELQFSAL
jgi:hypothetical protein